MNSVAAPLGLIRRHALRLLVAAISAMSLVGPFATARAEDGLAESLANIEAVSIGISQITPDGVRCGLEPVRLLQAVRQTLDTTGIALRDDAQTRITLSAITTRATTDTPDVCATAVMLGVYRQQSYFSAEAGWVRTGFVVLWQRSIVQLTPTAAHPSSVTTGARRLASQFLTDQAEQRRHAVSSEASPRPGG